MATTDQALMELSDKVKCYESTFQFFLSNEAFLPVVKDNLGMIIQQLQTDVCKLQEDANMINAQVQQEIGQQEANLITKVTYEVRKTLKPTFDTDLNTLRTDLNGLEVQTEFKLKETCMNLEDFC
ncbi:hypothetical protein BG006_004624 [Podila minutissima]|uniref:Uncharacterized protein n=1 Tax=Podila minutissima TaxID=64525 RepID=A0A9P5SA80_9FUNG|nr:hypothetical protein BG006_004624 [Podila minutissima]